MSGFNQLGIKLDFLGNKLDELNHSMRGGLEAVNGTLTAVLPLVKVYDEASRNPTTRSSDEEFTFPIVFAKVEAPPTVVESVSSLTENSF
jgi:hypothetical protein